MTLPPSMLNEYLRSMVTVRIRRRVEERICTRSEWRLLRRYERGGDEKVLLALDYVNIMAEAWQAWRRTARVLGLDRPLVVPTPAEEIENERLKVYDASTFGVVFTDVTGRRIDPRTIG